jgi:protein-disulfide isomerase
MKRTKQTITEYQCPYCDRIIASLSQSQAEYNYKLHHDSCKKREAMEVKKK